jgi:phosphatidylserine/phosphatidylglycerophosphate/cardiolipin synthase-like enzyme
MIERRYVLYQTPDDDVAAAVVKAANAATVSLRLLVYGFTLHALKDVLIAKHRAGLTTGVVADKTQSAGHAQLSILHDLVDAGVPVTITTSPKGRIMHQKMLLVDQERGALDNESWVGAGSYNLTESAEAESNHFWTWNDPSVCQSFWQQYQELEAWGKAHCTQLTPTTAPPSASSG